jgi:sugar transferase (PEP-CTERM system associated)
MITRHHSPRSLAIVSIELTWVLLTLGAVLAINMLWRSAVIWTDAFVLQLVLASALYATVFYYAGLYDFSSLYVQRDLFAAAVRGFSGLAVVFGLLFYSWPGILDFEPGTILVHLLLTTGFILFFRRRIDRVLTQAGVSTRLAIVGTGAEARGLAREILRLGEYAHEVTCFVGGGNEPICVGTPKSGAREIPLIPASELFEFAGAKHIKRILVATADLGGSLPLQELLKCKAAGYEVEDGHTFYERLLGRILTADLPPEWLIFSDGFTRSAGATAVKRCVDLVASTSLLVLAAPLCLLVAALIKLEDDGPVFFQQTRTGRNGEPFVLNKFRSMSVDAEKGTGPKWAEMDDPRVTRVGRWIRKLRIDEIPQAWNVLRGDMSFIGPRPERPEFVRELVAAIPYYDYRHGTRPGITGWAQVNFPYGATVEESRAKLEFDLYYLKNFSLLMDLYIMVRTVKILLFGWGSR